MSDLSKIKLAVIEKQDIILNRLTEFSYSESMNLIASLSSILTNLEWLMSEAEFQYNRYIIQYLRENPRETFVKAETMMKSSEAYISFKNIHSLKQCAARGLSIVKVHLNYLLRIKDGDIHLQ